MNILDEKGLNACAAWTNLIVYIADHPQEPIPMAQIRPAVELQAEYTIARAIDILVHVAAKMLDDYSTETAGQAEPEIPPDAA